jgi:hypothetical protein
MKTRFQSRKRPAKQPMPLLVCCDGQSID